MPSSSSQLNNFETCPKKAAISLTLERESLSPQQLLYRSIEFGLQDHSEDPGQAASNELFRLATTRQVESDQPDLIGLAEHFAALADIITWILRTGPQWRRSHPLPNWKPSLWTVSGGLRRIVLCDHWDERRALQEMRDWETLEGVIYGRSVSLIAVQLGAMRDGRRHGPLTKGWLHPRSRELRFRRRDHLPFSEGWEPIWREHFDGSRDEWLQGMTSDGVLEETILIHSVEWSAEETEEIKKIAEEKMKRIGVDQARNLTACFDALHPCPFRFPCAYFKEPEVGLGYVSLSNDACNKA